MFSIYIIIYVITQTWLTIIRASFAARIPASRSFQAPRPRHPGGTQVNELARKQQPSLKLKLLQSRPASCLFPPAPTSSRQPTSPPEASRVQPATVPSFPASPSSQQAGSIRYSGKQYGYVLRREWGGFLLPIKLAHQRSDGLSRPWSPPIYLRRGKHPA